MELQEFKGFSFAGGERHVRLPKIKPVQIRAVIRNSDDLMDLVLVADSYGSPPELTLPYIPYARQDRATTSDSPFSMRAFARIINSLCFPLVTVYEPHSMVAPALIENCVVHDCDSAVASYFGFLQASGFKDWLLFAPDAGAERRVSRVHQSLSHWKNMLPETGQAIKHRNPSTGRLEIGFITPNVKDRAVVVIDDICDGGATFLQLAPKLKEAGARSLHLFVAHGIFSKGIEQLKQHYQTIATTDSFYDGRFGAEVQVYASI